MLQTLLKKEIAIDNAQDEESIDTIVIDTKANIDALLVNEDFIITIEATTTSVVLGKILELMQHTLIQVEKILKYHTFCSYSFQ